MNRVLVVGCWLLVDVCVSVSVNMLWLYIGTNFSYWQFSGYFIFYFYLDAHMQCVDAL